MKLRAAMHIRVLPHEQPEGQPLKGDALFVTDFEDMAQLVRVLTTIVGQLASETMENLNHNIKLREARMYAEVQEELATDGIPIVA